ncbi:MAG: ATP-grasp domain-containing protein [Candidatus Pacearchaeota archaeon]
MKKVVIGYIFSEKRKGRDEKLFLKLAKKKNIELYMINSRKISNINEIGEVENIAKKCDIFYNNSAEEFALEIAKMIEETGKRVIDSSRTYYYSEDKWMCYLICKENKIPTLNTILLSENLGVARKELKDFGHWPVILKRVYGCMGEYVDKADDLNGAEKIIKKFWRKGSEKIPVIAQEFVKSSSYRVLVIGGKIVQTALKESKNWKATGVHATKFKKFPVDKELIKVIKRLTNATKINVCGVDLFKKNGKWIVLEINAEPAFDFFENEREKIIGLVLDLVKSKVKKR